MSDEWGHYGAGTSPAAQPENGPTAGAMLRQAREAAGLHVAALAVALKVPVRKLEALEEDRYDLMPDNVFVRALASSVCRTLKIDPQPVLERLPQTAAPRLIRDNDGINAPFRAPSDGAPPTWGQQLTRPVYLAVFALLLGAVVILLLPNVQRDAATQGAEKSEVVTAPAPSSSAEYPVQPQPAPPEPVAPTKIAAPAVVAPAPAAPAPRVVASAPVQVAPVPIPAVAASSASEAASGIVVFRAKGPSWVEVTDAKGNVAIRKVLIAGEEAGATGALPLRVTIGRIDHTDVQVRGKPFDLSRVSKDNVARFEVK
ncbi:MAG TPA: RodZ domain-containing protein [Ramlibacter sp.]|nr:RodZ domain-containing protein [Ramlibacter sp.]